MQLDKWTIFFNWWQCFDLTHFFLCNYVQSSSAHHHNHDIHQQKSFISSLNLTSLIFSTLQQFRFLCKFQWLRETEGFFWIDCHLFPSNSPVPSQYVEFRTFLTIDLMTAFSVMYLQFLLSLSFRFLLYSYAYYSLLLLTCP